MNAIEAGLRYRKLTLLFFLLATVFGVLSFLGMPRFEDPQLKIYGCLIQTTYPGADAEKVELLVTRPLEQKITALSEVDNISSVSTNSFSLIFVEFNPDADQDKTLDKIRRTVSESGALLPPHADEPEVQDDIVKTSCLILHLSPPSGQPVYALRETVDEWKEALEQVPGVEKVEMQGLPDTQVQVVLDLDGLSARGLSWVLVADAIQKRNESIPSGVLREGQMGLLVESSGEYHTLTEIEDTVVYRSPEGAPVRVKDVADVSLAPARSDALVKTGDRPSVALAVFPKNGRTVSDVVSAVEQRISEMQPHLPPGATVTTVFDQSESIRQQFTKLYRELLFGMILVILICIMGLRRRTALLVSLFIPVSAAVAFGPLALLGLELHQVSIASLIVTLGILVDDAIVVNDNIERHLSLGAGRYDAAVRGTREVWVSILTATTATVTGFVPLLLLKGDIGEFIRAIPLVVAATMFASMVVSFWLVPAARFWTTTKETGPADTKQEGLLGTHIEHLSAWYGQMLAVSLRKPVLTVTAALAIGAAALALLPFVGVQYFPYAERPEFVIDIDMPGGTGLQVTAQAAERVAGLVREEQGVKDAFVYVGQGIPKFYYNEGTTTPRGDEVGQILGVVEEGENPEDVVAAVRARTVNAVPGGRVTVRQLEQGPPVGAPIAVRIRGDDLEQLRSLAVQVTNVLRAIPGTENVHDDLGFDAYTVRVDTSHEAAARWGVAERDVSRSVRLAVEGLEVTGFHEGTKEYPVVLRTGRPETAGLSDLHRVWVPSSAGTVLPITQVAAVNAGWVTAAIQRYNLQRAVTVRAYTDGTLPNEILKQADGEITNISLPPGYSLEYGGENEERDRSFAGLGRLSLLVAMLVYLIIAAQFYSLTRPLIILLSVFLAVCGAVFGLFVTGIPLGFMALMGMISLAGIVVRNGIVLIDFVEQRLRDGMPLEEAIVEAGRVRLRPILLTSTTAIAALLPLAITGGSLWEPLAVTIISGLAVSTVLTLVVVPNAYLLLKALKQDTASRSATGTL